MRSLSRFALTSVLVVFTFLLGMSLLAGSGATNPAPGVRGVSQPAISAKSPSDANDTLCAQLEAQWPGMNLSLFSKLCTESSFVAAYEKYPYGFMGQGVITHYGRVVEYQYLFAGVAPCGNLSNGPPSTNCSEQVSWIGNATTGAITGPFYFESPVYIFGSDGSSSSVFSSSGGVVWILVVAVSIVVVVALLVVRNRLQP